MNWLDIVILILLIISVFSGLANGLIKTLFSLVGLIVGTVMAGHFYVAFSSHLVLSPMKMPPKCSFLIIFIGRDNCGFFTGSDLTKLVSTILLGWLNRFWGECWV